MLTWYILGNVKNKFFRTIIFEPRYRWLRHILFWTQYFIVFSIITLSDVPDLRVSFETCLVFFPVNLLYAYAVIYWLVPAFLIKEKYLSFAGFYCLCCIIGMILNFLVRHYVLIPLREGHFVPTISVGSAYRQVFALGSFVVMNTIALFGALIKLFKFWHIEQDQKSQVEKGKVNAELELLKAQLQPHFLFNTLNNLYVLVREGSDKAPGMLMRLSALLSYVLYECKSEEVLLKKEIEIIKNYVSLEQERYGDRLDVSMNFSGDIDEKVIVPMLFQPFIENAFKHGMSEQLGKVWMSIDLSVKKHELYFKLINSSDRNSDPVQPGGIGISNVVKRLELLYPKKYQLKYGMEEDVFIVSLTMELHQLLPLQSLPGKQEKSLNFAV